MNNDESAATELEGWVEDLVPRCEWATFVLPRYGDERRVRATCGDRRPDRDVSRAPDGRWLCVVHQDNLTVRSGYYTKAETPGGPCGAQNCTNPAVWESVDGDYDGSCERHYRMYMGYAK